jgi:hypothetical protein
MKRPQPLDQQPAPDFGAAFAVVAERVRGFKEIVIAVVTVASAIAGAAFGAWMYFASRDELRKERCLIEAQATTNSYNEHIDLYELLVDTKRKIKAVLANDLDKLSDQGKIEQIASISKIDSDIDTINKRREGFENEYKAAVRTLNDNKCPSDQTSSKFVNKATK